MTKLKKPNFSIEESIVEERGIKYIAGVDEVGRGCLAGPIVAAAVVFDSVNYSENTKALKGINDSKKLSSKQRTNLDFTIKVTALYYGIGEVGSSEIDRIGIGAANVLAFKRALDRLNNCDYVLIDGRNFRGLDYRYRCLEKGESKSISIAAASIVAKVYRDNLMESLNSKYDCYDFKENKGYGSPSHWSGLNKYGLSELHRKSFLTGFLEKENQTSIFENRQMGR